MYFRIFKCQLHRTVCSRPFWGVSGLMALISLASAFSVAVRNGIQRTHFMDGFIEGTIGLSSFSPFALLLVCALPGGLLLAEDIEGGVSRFLLIRSNQRGYLYGTMFTGMVSGFLSVFFGELACTLVCAIILPHGELERINSSVTAFSALYNTNHPVYCLVTLTNAGLLASCYALSGMIAYLIWPHISMLVFTPFILAFSLDRIFHLFGMLSLSPLLFASPQTLSHASEPILYLGLLWPFPILFILFRRTALRRLAL